ncbi:MAG: metal-dependent hydrolase [Actinomycetota bacterium]|nr:metal-dependent hydrolase [Actinomycetota bacterium]
MIFWHLGFAALVVYLTLGRRRVDYRFILAGAVLPDLIDAALGPFLFEGDAWRGVAHSLIANVAITVAIIVFLRGATRTAVFGIGVGWLLHLVGDAMWDAPQTFFWPLAGTDFASRPEEPYSWDVLLHPLDHVWLWAGELVGVAILAWFWVAFSLGKDGRFKLFLKDGYLRP